MLYTLTGNWKVILPLQAANISKTFIILSYLFGRLFSYAVFDLCLHIILKKAQLEQ